MLHYFGLIALFFAGISEGKNQNSAALSNYIIWSFSGSTYFPYAFDVCQTASLSTGGGYNFKCAADGKSVTLTTYTNAKCTTAASTEIINTTSVGYDTSLSAYAGYPGAFRCNASNEYVRIAFGIGSSACDAPANMANIQAAINVCTRVPTVAGYKRLSIYCNNYDGKAELQYYEDTDTNCSSTTPTSTSYANETCGYMFKFGTSIDIYGETINCTQSIDNNNSNEASGINYMVALVVASIALLFINH
jgi:hypothetical protein